MIYAYGAIALIIILIFLFSTGYKKEFFKSLNRKENPVKGFYPGAAVVLDLFRKITGKEKDDKICRMMESLYVRENAEREAYVFAVKKTAISMIVLLCAGILGVLLCLKGESDLTVKTLERGAPGSPQNQITLEAQYDGNEEVVDISVDASKYTREEILEMFDKSIEKIRKEMLADNESADKVSSPLNLITSYQDINIYWETQDVNAVNYNGRIEAEMKEDEELLVNLYATLSYDNVTKTYVCPVLLVAKTLSQKELLVAGIEESIEENNSIYDKQIKLPDKINGKEIVFNRQSENKNAAIPILALAAIIVIVIGYEKTLEDKLKKRKDQMMGDFTEIVSKLTLLYEAGLSMYRSWEKVVLDYEERNPDAKKRHFAYQEMRLALEKMKSGVSEKEAYAQFGKRCGLHHYMKLGNLLEQNLSKGTKGMKQLLKQEVEEAFDERRRQARKKGEEASTKLLVPMVIMLIVVIVIVSVPAFMSINI